MNKKWPLVFVLMFSVYTIMFSQQLNSQNSKLKIQNAWARPAAKGANSALYFVIENVGSKTDTLLGVQSKIAEEVEVHESFNKDNDRMGMRPAGKLAIQKKSKFKFKPGGFHVMLMGVEKDLRIGDSFDAVLLLKYAGKIKVKAEVRDMPMPSR